jgi:hypothetical protein
MSVFFKGDLVRPDTTDAFANDVYRVEATHDDGTYDVIKVSGYRVSLDAFTLVESI